VLMLVILGLLFGSFVNAFVWRLHEHKDWVRGRSECTHCHHPLAAKDLLPVLSWVLLKGRCRYCKRRIDDNPLIEVALPALFVLSYIWWPQPLSGQGLFDFVLWLILLVAFLILTAYDLRWMLLPDKVVFPVIALAVVYVLGNTLLFGADAWNLLRAALAVCIVSGLFAALYSLSRGRWIGFGDVKLGIALGLLAGAPAQAALLLFVASLAGTLISLPLVVGGKAGRKTKLPFGPLLLIGTFVVQLFGTQIVAWYTGLIW